MRLSNCVQNVPTTSRKNLKDIKSFVEQEDSRLQCLTLEDNVKEFGITYFGLGDKRQGIVHIIGPEQGFTLPGSTVVCGDSHTSTHGAFGALAFGIGTSEVEHVLATQTLITKRSKNMRIQVDGKLCPGVSSKDIILHTIGKIGTAGGAGTVIEFCGTTIQSLSMEARMSICNMAIEAGARAGMVTPDEITFDYLKNRPLVPKFGSEEWIRALKYWKSLKSDPGAKYDIDVFINAKDIPPTVTWGTSPEDVVAITGFVPDPETFPTEEKRAAGRRMLQYMGLTANTPIEEIEIDNIFIGSCTNGRIEDLRAAASVIRGRKVASNVKRALVVPGSGLVKEQAEAEKLDKIFIDAGFEWREAGCSMCLGMNPDILMPEERCASTSNRNFEGRQGAGGRTHLVSPVTAVACALAGKLADVRKLLNHDGEVQETSLLVPEMKDYFEKHVENDESSDVKSDNTIYTSKSSRSDTADSQNLTNGIPKFETLRGYAAYLDRPNIDTDAVIPKQYLKTIKRTGLGSGLFHEMRYKSDGSENHEFILNNEPFRRAKILVTGPNFGCGSSREHAPWALNDFGIKCIIAPSFADIFFNNTFKNGMLPIILSSEIDFQAVIAEARAAKEIEVDLPNQVIKSDEGKLICTFDVEEFRKYCLVNGLDEIGLTMKLDDKISAYEAQASLKMPWLDGKGYLKSGNGGMLAAKAVKTPKTNRGEEITEPLDW